MGCDCCRTAVESPRGFRAARSGWGRAGLAAAPWMFPFLDRTNSGGRQCPFRALEKSKPTRRQLGQSGRSLRFEEGRGLSRGLHSGELPQASLCRVLRVQSRPGWCGRI